MASVLFESSPFSILACVFIVILIGRLVWNAIPSVLPGIPHRGSKSRWFGDLRDLIKHRSAHGTAIPWMTEQCQQEKTPILQLFILPLQKHPLVVVNDFREAEDVAIRRQGEFDVSPMTIAFLSTVVPNGTLAMFSHERFKVQRKLWAGTMSTEFLRNVAAHQVFNSGTDLVTLWRWKAKLCRDAPFRADENLRHCALDAIWAAAVGSELGGLPSQLDAITTAHMISAPTDENGAALPPQGQLPPLYGAIDAIISATANLQLTPFPNLTHLIQSKFPRNKRARKLKEDTMLSLLNEARRRYASEDPQGRGATCAMEQVLFREAAALEKGGPTDATSDQAMVDELFTWLVAGHETTATTLSWGLKYFSENRDVQTKLRAVIIDAIGGSTLENPDQILGVDIPYLEATAWEMLRLANTAQGLSRTAQVDTEILGYRIPKGTQILFSTSGFSALDNEPLYVDETVRSPTSQRAKKTANWDYSTKSKFIPERWLKEEDGRLVFELNSGPALPFGGGIRGCFGRS